jgi:O-antigen/teichoic acid export membrane protein
MLGRSLYVTTAKLTGYVIRLALPIVLVRLLSKADFGAYRQFFLIETLISLVFQLGVNQALFYFIPRDRQNAGAYFVNSLLLNVVIYGLVFTAVAWQRARLSELLGMPVLSEQFWQVAVLTTVLMLITATDCFLLARQRIRTSAAFEIGGQLFTSVATVAVALMTRRLDIILSAIVVSRVIQLFVMLGYVQLGLNGFAARRYFFDLGAQVRYGVVLGLGGALFAVLLRVHELVVSSRFGPETFAVYSAGCTHIPILNFHLYGIAAVSLGRFAELVKADDRAGIQSLWRDVMVSVFSVAVPVTVVFLLVADPLVIVMFTERYADAVAIFRVNTLVRFAVMWNATLVLRALGRNDVAVYVNLAAVVLAAPVVLAGIRLGGLVGATFGELLLVLLARLTALFILHRISGLRLNYLVAPRDMVRFYRRSWSRGIETVASLRGRGGSPDASDELARRDRWE